MPEFLGRLVDIETGRRPAANTPALLYTATDPATFGLDVCNGESDDAHITVWILDVTESWTPPATPPAYTAVIKNQRVEADGTDGNNWVMPVKHLDDGDRVVVMTDVVGVTFYGHGYRFSPETL